MMANTLGFDGTGRFLIGGDFSEHNYYKYCTMPDPTEVLTGKFLLGPCRTAWANAPEGSFVAAIEAAGGEIEIWTLNRIRFTHGIGYHCEGGSTAKHIYGIATWFVVWVPWCARTLTVDWAIREADDHNQLYQDFTRIKLAVYRDEHFDYFPTQEVFEELFNHVPDESENWCTMNVQSGSEEYALPGGYVYRIQLEFYVESQAGDGTGYTDVTIKISDPI